MRSLLLIQLLLLSSSLVRTANAFVAVVNTATSIIAPSRTALSSSEGTDNSSNRKRRVKRKSPEIINKQVAQPENVVDFFPPRRREDAGVVSLKVTDVRDLVSGTSTSSRSTTTPSSTVPSPKASNAAARQTTTTTTTTSSEPSKPLDDSLQQLLLDARAMQDKSPTNTRREEDGGVSSKIRNAISTLVTVDFFVVCLFLLWFLAGIFCSVVLKDDTVQIAFNSNFQQLVQPALGILMIAAIADALFKQKDEENNN